MGRKKTTWTEEKISKYFSEGRGQGELANYKPWLTTQDVPSRGRTHRVTGWKTKRIHRINPSKLDTYSLLIRLS